MLKIFKKLFDNEYKDLEKFKKIADSIDALDEEISRGWRIGRLWKIF